MTAVELNAALAGAAHRIAGLEAENAELHRHAGVLIEAVRAADEYIVALVREVERLR
jgi:hypothetical protein